MDDDDDEMKSIFDYKPKEPKNPKRSARGKYNRRKQATAGMLDGLENATNELLNQDGNIYKKDEAISIKKAIDDFRKATGIATPPPEPLTQEQIDAFDDMIQNSKAWAPPSDEEMEEMKELLTEMRENGELDKFD